MEVHLSYKMFCSTAEYFYELWCILISPQGRVKTQTSRNTQRYYTPKTSNKLFITQLFRAWIINNRKRVTDLCMTRAGHTSTLKRVKPGLYCTITKCTMTIVIYLDFHSTNEHCDWLILGHVPLIKFKRYPDWDTNTIPQLLPAPNVLLRLLKGISKYITKHLKAHFHIFTLDVTRSFAIVLNLNSIFRLANYFCRASSCR